MCKSKLFRSLLLALLASAGIWVLAHLDAVRVLAAADIVSQLRLEKEKIRRGRVDVTHLVAPHIPVGTTVDAARETLEKNGFKIYKHDPQPMDKRDLPDGAYYLAGTTTERSITPFTSYEYRIVLTIADSRVARVFARIFLHGL